MVARRIRPISPTVARRLAIVSQRLANPPPRPDGTGIMEVVRALGALQLDPTGRVARSHLLVLWSRLGPFDATHLDALLWKERRLFEYRAFIVPTDRYPIYRFRMQRFATGDTAWVQRVRTFLERNGALRRHILAELRRHGPLASSHFEDRAADGWQSTGWTAGRNVAQMLEFLWAKGEIMVTARQQGERLWDLTQRCLPIWTPRERLSERDAGRQILEHALRARGAAWINDLPRWPGRPEILSDLASEGRIVQVLIEDAAARWPGPWYVHTKDLPLLSRLERGQWEPRTTLLSPFDNLIKDRERTERLFDFHFRMEIYVPKEKRRYGYFVMPILHGDRLIGRIDPQMDRTRHRLVINAVYAERDAPMTLAVGRSVAAAIEDLAAFLGATEIMYGRRRPAAWTRAFR